MSLLKETKSGTLQLISYKWAKSIENHQNNLIINKLADVSKSAGANFLRYVSILSW